MSAGPGFLVEILCFKYLCGMPFKTEIAGKWEDASGLTPFGYKGISPIKWCQDCCMRCCWKCGCEHGGYDDDDFSQKRFCLWNLAFKCIPGWYCLCGPPCGF